MKRKVVKQVEAYEAFCDLCAPKTAAATKNCVICGNDLCDGHAYVATYNELGVFCKKHLDDSPSRGTILRLFNGSVEEAVDWVVEVAEQGVRKLLEQKAPSKYKNIAVLIKGEEEDGSALLFPNTLEHAMDIVDELEDEEHWSLGILELKKDRWERIRPSRVKGY